jgi:hypothetical protein
MVSQEISQEISDCFVLSSLDVVKTVGQDKATLDEANFKVRLSELLRHDKK